MTPSPLEAVPAIGSAIGLPLLETVRHPNFPAAITELASQLATGTASVDFVRVAYLACLLVGVVLYLTRFRRRLGKDLMIGGALMVVVGEYIIPAVAAALG